MKTGLGCYYDKILALSQYARWADIQSHIYLKDLDIDSSCIIHSAAYFASAMHVVLEGWREIKENDIIVNQIIDKYPEFIETMRLCRNGTFHFQKEIIHHKIMGVVQSGEHIQWLLTLKNEIERCIFLSPALDLPRTRSQFRHLLIYHNMIDWKPAFNPYYYAASCLRRLSISKLIQASDANQIHENDEIVNIFRKILCICPNSGLCKLTKVDISFDEFWRTYALRLFPEFTSIANQLSPHILNH